MGLNTLGESVGEPAGKRSLFQKQILHRSYHESCEFERKYPYLRESDELL